MATIELRNKRGGTFLHVDSSAARTIGTIINRDYKLGETETDCKMHVLDYMIDNSNIPVDGPEARLLALYSINKVDLIYTTLKHSDGLLETIAAFNLICSAVRGLQAVTGDLGAVGDLAEIAVKLALTPLSEWSTLSLRVSPIGKIDFEDKRGNSYEIGSNGKSFNSPITDTDYIVYGIIPQGFDLSAYNLLTLVQKTFKVYRSFEFISVFGAVIDYKRGGVYGRVRYYSTTEKILASDNGVTVGVWGNFINAD